MAKLLLILALVALTSAQDAEDASGNSTDMTVTPTPTHVTTSPTPVNTSSPVVTPTPVNTSSPVVTPSRTISLSSSIPLHASVTPSPTLHPIPPLYVLNDQSGKECIAVNATIKFLVSYRTNEKNESMPIPVHSATVDNATSFCNRSVIRNKDTFSAQLILLWKHNTLDYTLNFTFIGMTPTESQKWHLSNTTVSIPPQLFNSSVAEKPINETLVARSTDLMGDNLDYQRSYLCNSPRNLSMTVANVTSIPVNATGDYYSVTIEVSNFQVQAFQFNPKKPPNNGLFDDAATCSNDMQDNKIVPIAVGAALAGLVIIVLIAYIIGRLRSRKQSSYEALS